MKLATIRGAGGTTAVRIDGDEAVDLGLADVGEVLRRTGWRDWARTQDGPRHPVDRLDYAPLILRPDKIVCVGLNYRGHIVEMGGELPAHPTLFAKYRQSLIGARDDIVLPAVSDRVDWEAELAVIVGSTARHVTGDAAEAAIAGYAVLNDVSVRDFQNRTLQWLQGKTFERSTPLGPWLVTPDESPGPGRTIECEVDGEVRQRSDTADLVHGPAALVAYLSKILTLEPGDVIATGTPAGVGAARDPQVFLSDGQTVITRITGLGECRNLCRKEQLG